MMHLRRLALAASLALTASAAVACSSSQPTPDDPATTSTSSDGEASSTVDVQLLGFNDFHGHIEAPGGNLEVDGETIKAGGAAHMARYIDDFRTENPNTAVVVAGDLIGASPFVSASWHDEPTIDVMNAVGLDAVAVGNHEFDEGWKELKRVAEGGCHPEDGCRGEEEYEGADFPFLSANVLGPDGDPIFAPYVIREFDGEKVGIIGMALDTVPSIVIPSGVKGLTFKTEVETIDKYAEELQSKGVESIVVVVHEGGYPKDESAVGLDSCPGLKGPIVDIVKNASDAVDAYLTGHTHQTYNCKIDGKPVTSAKSYGRVLTRLQLKIDRETGDVVEASARNVAIRSDSPANETVAELVEDYAELAAEEAERAVGQITETLERSPDASGETELGRVIADSQLAATSSKGTGGAVVAFMNPGGIREPLEYDSEDEDDEDDDDDDDDDEDEDDEADEKPGVVTYGDLHKVQPFGNQLIVMTLTGEQIHTLLEQQWQGQDHPRVLQVSEGFNYTWHPERPAGNRVDIEEINIQGEPLDPEADYRVTVNNYLAEGGDNFTVLTKGTDRFYGRLDVDVLAEYFESESPIGPDASDRIERAPAETAQR